MWSSVGAQGKTSFGDRGGGQAEGPGSRQVLEGQGEGRHGGGEAEDVANMDAANEARRGPEDQSQRNQPISYSIAPALETHLRPSPKVFSLNTGLGTGASTEAAPTSDKLLLWQTQKSKRA